MGGSSRDAHVLTLMNPIGDRQEATVFTDEVARLSKGSAANPPRAFAPSGQTDFEAAVIGDVRRGRTDLGLAGSRAWKGSLRALNAPLLIDSYLLEERV